MNLKTVRAYNLKLSLQIFWSTEERGVAEQYLKRWYFWATHSRLQPMIDACFDYQKTLEWCPELF